LMMP